jgi:ATP synthase F1 complex assembly factor 2
MATRLLSTKLAPRTPAASITARFFHASTVHTTANKKNAPRDVRTAGLRRFYQVVDIAPAAAPWDTTTDTSNTATTTATPTVKSPISAGVDGTDSATGVSRQLPNRQTKHGSHHLYQQLMPRQPGRRLDVTHDATTSTTTTTTDWWTVTLDGRAIRTPLGQILTVPSRQLAAGISSEWNHQASKIKPVQMPLMTLACTALDQTAANPDAYRAQVLQFVPTDTVCYWADPVQDRILHKRQGEAWNDLMEAAKAWAGDEPARVWGNQGLLVARNNNNGSNNSNRGLPHTPQLLAKCREWVHGLDAWHLAALSSAAAESKSFWIAWAMLHPACNSSTSTAISTSVQAAMQAARVEEEFQIESWGVVEGQHDYDRLNCSVQMHAAVLLCDSLAVDNGWAY